MVVYWRCLARPWMTMVARWHPYSLENEAFTQVPMKVPPSTIKTAGVSLINREEQLSTMPLEDKDNQGGTWVCSSNEHQLVNQQKSRKVDGRRTCNYPHLHLLDWIVQRNVKCKREVLLNGPKTMSPRWLVNQYVSHIWFPYNFFACLVFKPNSFSFMHNNLKQSCLKLWK